jgi:hypothetical protein
LNQIWGKTLVINVEEYFFLAWVKKFQTVVEKNQNPNGKNIKPGNFSRLYLK